MSAKKDVSELKEVRAFFPRMNKNNTLAEYQCQSEGDYERVKIQKTLLLTDSQYQKFVNNFLADDSRIAGHGGSGSDFRFLDGSEVTDWAAFWQLPQAVQDDYRAKSYVFGILVNNIATGDSVIVNPEGYSYARYVGLLNYVPPDPTASVTVGQTVYHPEYGQGMVDEVVSDGKVSVMFEGRMKSFEVYDDTLVDKAKYEEITKKETKFIVGETYATRSLCNWDCVYSFVIEKRTDKSVWVQYHGKSTRRKIRMRNGIETIDPHGSYSMSPILDANDIVREGKAIQ